jgi:hypothetical protein
LKSISSRVEKLEQQVDLKEDQCFVLTVVYDGTEKPPKGAARRFIEDNKLCEGCTRRLCVHYWNGQTFNQKGNGL